MPVYVYECQKCGHSFELLQSISEPPRKRCPECRGKVNKVLTPVGVVFKGGGFYCTDSRKGAGGNNHKSCVTSEVKPETASKESGAEKSGSGKTEAGKD